MRFLDSVELDAEFASFVSILRGGGGGKRGTTIMKCVVPDLFHGLPVGDDAACDGVSEGK